MNCHQIITGAVNPGDRCFAVGYVEGVPFTAYASGCDIVILSSNFQRVQIIPGENHGNIQVGCIDCSTENGKIAASFANKVHIFEPTPQASTFKKSSHVHKLDYQWYETGSFQTGSLISNLSWNHNGSKILTGSESIQLWARDNEDPATRVNATSKDPSSRRKRLWEIVWQCMTATPVFHLLFSPDGQFFASAGKADRLVKIWYQTRKPTLSSGSLTVESTKGDGYSFVYIAHPRAVVGFSWRRTSKYMASGTVASVLVTSCRDNICRLWVETLLPSSELVEPSSHSGTVNSKARETRRRPQFSLGQGSRRRRKSSSSSSTNASCFNTDEGIQTNGHGGLPLHFHIAATINPNTDIPLLPAIGHMSKGNTANFVVNWLNNKELQYTLAAETLLQVNKEDKSESELESSSEEDSSSEDEGGVDEMIDGTDDREHDTPGHTPAGDEHDSGTSILNESNRPGQMTPPEILTLDGKISRPRQFGSFPSVPQLASLAHVGSSHLGRLQKKFDALLREWNQGPDMLFSIHPIDGSFLLWLVDWVDEAIPGVHRQPQVSFSCRIPQAFPVHDATTLCSNLVLYRSNLTMDPRASRRQQPNSLSPSTSRPVLTPSYSFSQRLGAVPPGVNIYAFTPRVSMLSKHSNGTLNQWEISFSENSKFQTVLNVAHTSRCCGHRFSLNHISCHPILPLLLTASHHNVPKVAVDPDIITSRSRVNSTVSGWKGQLGAGEARPANAGRSRAGSISLFGRNLLSQSEHQRQVALYNADADESEVDPAGRDEVVIPDEIMDELNQEINWPDMSAPTGLCSELILWRVFPVGPLTKESGVMELTRINSPFLAAFSHMAWFPNLLPSSCLGALSNSPSACFVASDGYTLRVFQTLIDARSLLNEVLPETNQFEGYLSSSSPIKKFIDPDDEEIVPNRKPNIISLQSTARPGCIIELDSLASAKQVWHNVQLMHIFPHRCITDRYPGRPIPRPVVDAARPYTDRFYLVVLDRDLGGNSSIHMWYIHLEAKMLEGGEVQNKCKQKQDDVLYSSSADSSDNEEDQQFDCAGVPQASMKVKTYSRKVCTQRLALPPGVAVVSATPATSHPSSSAVYPATLSTYMFSTACSDEKLRFWCCKMQGPEQERSEFGEVKRDLDSSNEKNVNGTLANGLNEESSEALDGDVMAEAEYRWQEWDLIAQDSDANSSLGVPGIPVALSCAYSGKIVCVYRTDRPIDPNSPLRMRERKDIPLQAVIYECESSGGSEWVFEDKLDLGFLDMNPSRQIRNTEMTNHSSQMDDLINLRDTTTSTTPTVLDLSNVNLNARAGRQWKSRLPLSRGDKKELPVQIMWFSKEDGSHLLTASVGAKVIVFAPVLANRANVHLGGLMDKLQEQGLLTAQKPQGPGSTLLAKEDLKPKWMPLWTITLRSVDGLPPHSKMLTCVRPGILVVGLENEMHVYSQWKGSELPAAVTKKKVTRSDTDTAQRNDISGKESLPSTRSVDMLSVPMTKMDREQSYSELNRLNHSEMEEPIGSEVFEPEDLTSDMGIYEYSYMACPVLPQYHPKQLMELLNCGKVRRVKAILAHLVRCFAGDGAIQKALMADDTDSVNSSSEMDDTFMVRPRSMTVSTSPADQPLMDETKLDYIELVSIPPLPLYALIAADKAESSAPLPTTTQSPTVTKVNNPSALGPQGSDAEYSKLFSYGGLDTSASPTFDVFAESTAADKLSGIALKLGDGTYFGIAQLRLLTNYLTHMHLPGLSSLDQMHLLALADTVASTKTEVTTHNTAGTGTAIGKDGAGYAHTTGIPTAHAGETLDECGLRFLLAMRFHVCLSRSLPPRQQVQLRRQGLATSHFAWAFHSEAQDELLTVIYSNQTGKLSWAGLRAMGVGWWTRNDVTLKRCIEKLAKAQFQADKNPLDAALFYLAMKKKTLLWGLFRSVSDARMTQFFSNDFSQERWRKAALKNAFALLGHQRFDHAAAFFLLAGSLGDAVEVCLNNMNDIQLAMVIARLYEEDLKMPTAQKEILYRCVLECDGSTIKDNSPSKDPFLRSMAHWLLKDYKQSLDTLIIPPARNKQRTDCQDVDDELWGNPDVFNFYNYLRTHPLLIRRQFAVGQDKPASATSVLVAGFGGRTGASAAEVGGDITNLERKLFFATAHAHSAAGCPMLTVEVLSTLPKVKSKGDGVAERTDTRQKPKSETGTGADMINTGTIGSFTGKTPTAVEALDWGVPLTNGRSEPAVNLDWGSPIGSKLEDELKLDWSDDSEQNDKDDQRIEKEMNKKNAKVDVGNEPSINVGNSVAAADETATVGPADEGTMDIFAQQLKFSSCLKIMVEELRTLATGFEVEGGQLRYQLYVWLENEVEMLKELCNYNMAETTTGGSLGSDDDEEEEDVEPVGEAMIGHALHARWIDLEEKRQRAARRKKWLKSHHYLLRTLLSYAIIYGLNGGGLSSVAIELLLLLQEVQQEKLQHQLSTPLPLPTTLPLLSASIASCKTVISDPILHLRNFMHDILGAILDLTAPPSPKRHLNKVQTVHRLSMALSACIYQTLCDSDNFSGAESHTKTMGMDVYDGRNTNVMYRSGNLVSVSRRKRNVSSESALTVTSLPAKWPGVATLQALLVTERDEDSSPPNVFLCESLFTVYISVLVHALTTHNANTLFRLASHSLDTKMWSAVFGGGAKVLDQPKTSQKTTGSAAKTGDQMLNKQRNRYMLRLLGKASNGRLPSSAAEEKPMPRDVFVPPETSIMDYLMIKPYISPSHEGIDFDSDASDSSDEEENYEPYTDEGLDPFAQHAKPTAHRAAPGEMEHSDYNSYSWCLMRYALIKLILSKVQEFLPKSGIELAELPVASPKLHSILKRLEQWQQALMRKLNLFAGPPIDYIPGCNVDTPSAVGGPALLRYKGLLECTNTPFRCNNSAALPAKRLWNYLVRQEVVQDIFITYIFKKKRGLHDEVDSVRGPNPFGQALVSTPKVRIIHKEQEKIPAFCFNKADWKNVSMNGEYRANPTGVVVSTQRGLLELDISLLLSPQQTFWMEEEMDDRGNTPNLQEDEFLMVTPMERTMSNPFTNPAPAPSMITSGFSNELNLSNQTGRGTNIIMSRPLYHIRRLAAHPSLPYYLSGSNDGSVHMWEWGHTHKLYTHRPSGQYPKVTQMHFNDQGNKFGVSDDSGKMSLWQVGMNSSSVTKPFWSKQCHNKSLYDFSFLGSSSFLATAGLSSESKNLCLWDTLMPMNKSLVHGFICHEGGCPTLAYCPRQQILITGSKRGDISIYDVRQRKLRHTFQAHETAIKCLTVDPSEEYFVSGSAEGNIKVWCLSVHSLLQFYPGQHPRSNFFRQAASGVLQLAILPSTHMYSCGADGTIKWRLLPEWDHLM